ncbi:hypothetical protein [Geobacter sp. AOG2]|uniref:hypothetical protein n=1 Tax=Geobacter sp. AOG2 TaxID=1566347 RepID=UPI001CC5D673|nr:hypothetical protein [Geobacter sp. AOG2]GFE61867.1 hypothetical protein AOG2_24550 [Geobacter sp. AOG2]
MNRLCSAMLCLTCLCLTGPAYADSLIITYRNGNTQTVPLDEKSSSIQSLHYLPADAPASINKPVIPKPHDAPGVQDKPEAQAQESREKAQKPAFRIKWADPATEQ